MAEDLVPTLLPVLPAQQVTAAPGEWNYIGTTTAPPSTGQVRLDNASQNLATHMWVHKTTATSTDASADLASIVKGVEISLTNKSDSTKWQTYSVSANPVDGGTYIDFPVVWLRGGATIPAQRTLMTTTQPAAVSVTGQSMTLSRGTVAVAVSQRAQATGVSTTVAQGAADVTAQGRVLVTGEALAVEQGDAGATSHALADVTGMAVTAEIGAAEVTANQSVEIYLNVGMLHMKACQGEAEFKGQQMTHDYAYPFDGRYYTCPGMTIRQYYAACAMQGFISATPPAANMIGAIANYSFRVADSMIAYERAEKAGLRPIMAGSPKPARPAVAAV